MGADGEISAYLIDRTGYREAPPPLPRRKAGTDPLKARGGPPAPPPHPQIADLVSSAQAFPGEDPAARLAAVAARLRRQGLPTTRPLGLPPDLALYADPSWAPIPAGALDDEVIDAILLRYCSAGIRRAQTTVGALGSGGLAAASAEQWQVARDSLDDLLAATSPPLR